MTSPTDTQLPSMLPVLPGVALAGQYGLTECEPIDRGDTLSACALSGGRVALLVADVVGHGFGAALAAAQVRAILWSDLADGASLEDAVARLDRYAERHSDLGAAALSVVVLDLGDGSLEYVAAGMLPPLVLTPHGSPRFLGSDAMQPIGTRGATHVRRAVLRPDEMVVLSTNGLVSTSSKGLRTAADEFGSLAARVLDDSVERGSSRPQCADDVGRALVSEHLPLDPCDDVALLVAQRMEAPPRLSVDLTVDTFDVHHLRRSVSGWLDELGAGLADHISLGHALVELATNVVKHAHHDDAGRDHPFEVDAALDDTGEVTATVTDRGRWREHEAAPGRGLVMAGGLMDSVQVHRSQGGTAVVVRTRLGRPVQMWKSERGPEDLLDLPLPEELSAVAVPGYLLASGPIDEASADLFHAALIEATQAGTASATVDLTGVSHLSSPGVQSLFEILERSVTSGVELKIVASASTPARQILDLVGLPVGP